MEHGSSEPTALRRELEERGVLRLPGAVDAERVREIRERIWLEAGKRFGMQPDDPSSWVRVPPSLLKRAKQAEDLFEPLLAPDVAALVDALLGPCGWVRPPEPGQLLMTPPGWLGERDPCRLPDQMWHLDAPAPAGLARPGVQLFCALDRLEPGGGGTLMAAGSHRLVEAAPERERAGYRGRSADLKRALPRTSPWFRDLLRDDGAPDRDQRFREPTVEEGVPLQVVEVCGEPGDLFVMHLWTFHAPNPNRSGRMRAMLTERLFTPDALARLDPRRLESAR